MKILVIPNLSKKGGLEVANEAIKTLLELKATVIIPKSYEEHFLALKVETVDDDKTFAFCDRVLALGGDGTIIEAAKKASVYDKPILGMNVGRLGFVAELERDEFNLLSHLLDEKIETSDRMMIKVSYPKNGKIESQMVLNDATITRGSMSKILDFKIYAKGISAGHFRADGIIMSTPTGSTAYSLSAGGPIVCPNMQTLIMTPICAHAMFSRACLFEPNDKIEIKCYSYYDSDILLTLDGESCEKIYQNDIITFEKSDIYAKMIKIKPDSFVSVLFDKLSTLSE